MPHAAAAMAQSPANSHPAAEIVYGALPPLDAAPKRARKGKALTVEQAPDLAPAPNVPELPDLPERHLAPPLGPRDRPRPRPERQEPSSIPVELPSLEPVAVQERPALPAPPTTVPQQPLPTRVRPTPPDYPDARQEMRLNGLEYTSRLLHSGRARQHLNVREHGSTPSGLRGSTTRETALEHMHRTGKPDGFAPWSKAIENDEHFRPLPEAEDEADWLRHGGDAGAHARNAGALISSPEDAASVLGHLNTLTSDPRAVPPAHSASDRRALSACVHVTGAALELAHAREALAKGLILPAMYDAARDHVRQLADRHGLGQNEHVKAAFETDADPKARQKLRADLDLVHGNAHRAYATAAQSNAVRGGR